MSLKEKQIRVKINEKLRLIDVSWERIFINFVIEVGDDNQYDFAFARLIKDKSIDNRIVRGYIKDAKFTLSQIVSIKPSKIENGKYFFKLNMSAIKDETFLDNGAWRFVAKRHGNEKINVCVCTNEMAYKFSELDRIFRYGKQKYSYNVYLTTTSDEGIYLLPILHSQFMIENKKWNKRYIVSDRRTFVGKVLCIVKKVKIGIICGTYKIIEKLTRKNGNRILFMSESKPYLWGNLKYIDDRLKERGLDKKFNISYNLREAVGKNNSIFSWFKTIRKIAKQDFIFLDDYAPLFNFLNLSERTKLIQVWHAGEGFKSVGYCRFGRMGSPYPCNNAHKKYDYAITASERLVDVYSEVFGLPPEKVLPFGMARLDGYLDENVIKEKIEKFYHENPRLKGKKIILFAPTFRGVGQSRAFYEYDRLDFKKIYDVCGDEYIWAFKMHPFVIDMPEISTKYSDRIVDLSEYENINDLYYVTEILITDYSSAYFEFSLLNRPILFYTYDREMYELRRGVHKPIKETAPGKVCDTFDELVKALKDKDYEYEKTEKFREENFGNYDGKAADRIINQILIGKMEECTHEKNK